MKIKVNGEEKNINLEQENAHLSTVLNLMGYEPNTIVVELNNLIINSTKWGEVKLKDGDNLEIVSIVGGG
jgi:sulfur carrier protein